jgi:hypothetical protein
MNPYTPPTTAISQDSRVALKNPARYLLYPSAAICVLCSLSIVHQFLFDGFEFTTVDYLHAASGVLEILFGISAFLLAVRKLSKKTRVLTILWSCAAACIILTCLFFETPTSMQDLFAILVIGFILLLVAFLASRSVPQKLGLSEAAFATDP